MAQFVEQSLPTPLIRGLNPVSRNFYLLPSESVFKRRKSKDAGNGTLKNCPVPHMRQRWWSARSLPTPEIPSSNQVISNVLLKLIFHVVTIRTTQSE